ncbi:MAG: serine/threonine protein kinase [Nitrospira sp.]|nr:serine/threonine protein kinase [Nitrospira sp.]
MKRPGDKRMTTNKTESKSTEPNILLTTFGRYTRGKIIGEGGAGNVFEATDEGGKRFAVKLLNPVKSSSDKRRRFKNEILFGVKNEHKNIIKIVDHGLYGENLDTPFYVMPLYEETLRGLVKKGIPQEKVLPYFAQLLDGVEAAHLQGIAHRDLKPENVLHDKASDLLIVADFGIAQFNEEELYTLVETRATDRLANFQYAAPEQRERGKQVNHLSDIYALGLILNEMFTGAIPLGSGHKTISSVAQEYSYLDDLVEQMRRQSPAERPSSIERIKELLIVRKNDFVSQQTISKLRNVVIPSNDLDDPIVNDPIRLVGADYDDNRLLILRLSQPVNNKWVDAIRTLPVAASVLGMGPNDFRFMGDVATIPATERDAQQTIDHFKQWLVGVKERYRELVKSEKEANERKARQELAIRLADAERTEKIRKSLRV